MVWRLEVELCQVFEVIIHNVVNDEDVYVKSCSSDGGKGGGNTCMQPDTAADHRQSSHEPQKVLVCKVPNKLRFCLCIQYLHSICMPGCLFLSPLHAFLILLCFVSCSMYSVQNCGPGGTAAAAVVVVAVGKEDREAQKIWHALP